MKLKNFIALNSRFLFQLYANSHDRNVVSKLVNVVKLEIENCNVASTLSKVVNINVVSRYYINVEIGKSNSE